MKAEYQEVVFTVSGSLTTNFVVITAYNPYGQLAPPARNQHQDQTLHAVLEGRGFSPVRVIGMSPDQTHQEPSWAIACTEAEAVELGKYFKQEAIYIVEEDRLTLVSCQTLERVDLGAWSQRLLK